MAHPRKGEPGYEEFLERRNARRRKRRLDPEVKQRDNERRYEQARRKRAEQQ